MNTTFSDIRNKIISDKFIEEFKDILDKMEIKENELPNFNNLNEDELQSFFELIFKKATDKSQEKLINEKSQRDSNLFSEFVKAPSFEILKASMKKKKEYFYSPENLPKYVIEELREIFIFTNEIRGWNFKEDAEEEGLIDVKPEKEPQIEKEMNMLREKFEYEDDEEYLIFIKKVFSKIIEKTEFSQEDTDNINRWMPLIPIVIEQIKINKDYYPIFSKQGSLYGSSAVIAEVSKTKVITLLKINRKKIKDIKQKLKKDLSEVILNWYLDDIKLKIIRLEYTNLGDSSEYKPFRDRYRKKNKIDLEKISDEIPKYIGEFFQEKLKNLVLIPINEIEYKMKVELFIKSKIIEKRKPIKIVIPQLNQLPLQQGPPKPPELYKRNKKRI